MLFCSQKFAVFFAFVFVLYWAIPWRRPRVWLLLAASFWFYASWSGRLACVVFASAVADYAIARGLDAVSAPRWRKLLLGCSLAGNLGLLCYFKYANFFLQSLEECLRAGGAAASLPLLSVMLPIGISFYTFEAINYTVDVYRRRIPAERNLAHFLLFILFFPHLVAGPIVRAADFLPQIRRRRRWNWLRAQVGLQFFVVGLFKKMVVADRMAALADLVFGNPAHYHGPTVWLAVFAYSVQIYCDFSGYSDMAVGAAHLLGYKLSVNFRQPYLAVNVQDFWRRWHISLSTWLRDYLFIPLGGNRRGVWQTSRNLMITMTLGGLWHGASWHFVLWGALHGALLFAHRWFQGVCAAGSAWTRFLHSPPGTVLRVAATFLIVSLAWVFFRAPDISSALQVFERLFDASGWRVALLPSPAFFALACFLGVCHVVARLPACQRWAVRAPGPLVGLGYAFLLLLAVMLAPEASQGFIYFQF